MRVLVHRLLFGENSTGEGVECGVVREGEMKTNRVVVSNRKSLRCKSWWKSKYICILLPARTDLSTDARKIICQERDLETDLVEGGEKSAGNIVVGPISAPIYGFHLCSYVIKN